jgi:hypothetical protein
MCEEIVGFNRREFSENLGFIQLFSIPVPHNKFPRAPERTLGALFLVILLLQLPEWRAHELLHANMIYIFRRWGQAS